MGGKRAGDSKTILSKVIDERFIPILTFSPQLHNPHELGQALMSVALRHK